MKILGVTLAFPNTPNLISALVAGGLIVSVFIGLCALGLIPPLTAALLASSGVGGTLANAHGASIKRTGWRGAVIAISFSAILSILVFAVWVAN